MDLSLRLMELARIVSPASPIVSVYLDTRWADEHQRDRVRLFLKNELRRAQGDAPAPDLAADLEWVRHEAEALIAQGERPSAQGVAFFACRALGLREVVPVRVPFENAFVLGPTPFLRPLARSVAEAPPTLVVFVDAESARLIPLEPDGVGAELRLESEVPGHHRRGGWAQLAQSRYQRHIQDHRGRHFEAVQDALAQLAEGNGIQRVVLAGEPRTLGAFRKHLPGPLAARIAGSVPGSRHEPAAVLLDRAAALLRRLGDEEAAADLDAVLTEAAKGGQAVAGLDETLEAVTRAAVHRLYLLKGFRETGGSCPACGRLEPSAAGPCRGCGAATSAADLGERMVARVTATRGTVVVVDAHEALARLGGVAARLRYPL